MNKNHFGICSFFLICFTALSVTIFNVAAETTLNYGNGDFLYVLSNSGIILRSAPDIKSARITTLRYGSKVRVTDEHPGEKPIAVGGFKGYWVKAVGSGKEGYLFDGFMSRYAAPAKCSNCSFNTIIEKYTDHAFRLKHKPVVKKDDYFLIVKKVYTNGFVQFFCQSTLDMKKTRLPEAFLLFRLMGLEIMKGQMLPLKNRQSQRKMKGMVYNERITVTVRNNEIQGITIKESSKSEDGMSDGAESESIEFLKTADGTIVKYSASGS